MRDKEAFLYAPTTIDPARRRSPWRSVQAPRWGSRGSP